MEEQRAPFLLLVLALSHVLAGGVTAVVLQSVGQAAVISAAQAQLLVGVGAVVLGGLVLLWGRLRQAPEDSRPPTPERTGTPEAALARVASDRAAYKRRSEMLGRYLRRLSLELRTSLTAVVGYAELVKEEAQREERWTTATDVDRILVGARTGLDLVQDTLALAALERGGFSVEPGAFQLGTVLHDIIGGLRPLGGSLGTRIELESGAFGSVYTDRSCMRHILQNIIARGIHAAPGGLVQVRVYREGTTEQPWIRVEVLDDGPLLTPAQLDEIFAVAPPDASDTAGPGSSIGLLVARRFADCLGGELSAEARPRGGTRLTLKVPAKLAPEAVGQALGSTRLEPSEVHR